MYSISSFGKAGW
jgi:ABC-type phosphate transport system ATPase subunit